MSISSRITTMEEHIRNAYDKIEDLGIDTTNINKNINNISTILENAWDTQSKIKIVDTEDVTISNTRKGKMKLDLKGNTKQEQLTGKNLLDKTQITQATNKETITQLPTGFKIATTNGWAGKLIIENLEANTDYYLHYITTNITGNEKRVRVFAGTTTTTEIANFINGTGGTFNTGNNTTINIWFYVAAASEGEVDFTDVMLTKGSTATDYEPYCGRNTSPKSTVMKYQLKMLQEMLMLRYKIRI